MFDEVTIGGWIGALSVVANAFFGKLAAILAALPSAPAAVFATLRGTAFPGSTWALGLVVLCALILATPRILARSRLAAIGSPATPLGQAIGALLVDALAALAVLALATAGALAFSRGFAADELALALVWAATRWRLAMLGLGVFLRAARPEIRILPATSEAARAATRWAGAALGLTTAFATLAPVLLNRGLPLPSAQSLALTTNGLACLCILRALVPLAGPSRLQHAAAVAAGLTALTLFAIFAVSVVELEFALHNACIDTLVALWVPALLLGLLHLARRDGRASAVLSARPPDGPERIFVLLRSGLRGLLAAALAIGIYAVARTWAIDVFGLAEEPSWAADARALRVVLVGAVAGFAAYEALRVWGVLRFGAPRTSATPGEDEQVQPGSRMATILPILSKIVLAGSLALALLLGMSELGLNIAPLLAGAGIVGLAISFGSQALVRDVVSGVFFIVDDAFRAGEYIDTGRLKGSVERISLRSLRLRHQNGQVHTIPYGQIGSVTNFSREWSTVKFNLRLAREADVQQVRKIAKEVGLALLDDPEFGPEFIAPLKLQGVAEVQENAIVLRFKFTVRPLKPASVQREATRRLYDALLERKIAFPIHAISLTSPRRSPT